MKNSSAAAMVWPYSREPKTSRVSRKAPAPAPATSHAALSKPVPKAIAASTARPAAASRWGGRSQTRARADRRARRPRRRIGVLPVAAWRSA